MRSVLKITLLTAILLANSASADGYFPEDLARMNGTQSSATQSNINQSSDSALDDLKRELRRTSDSLARIQKTLESVSQAGYQNGMGVGLDSKTALENSKKGLLIASVDVDHAIGWSDYTPGASRLYRFPRGAVVAIEERVGDWYRVHGSTGTRSWIEASNVVFGTGDNGTFEGSLRVRGYDSEAGQSALSLPFAQFAYLLPKQ